MNSLCVYCGSSAGVRSDYADAAAELAGLLARRGTTLVYGGSSTGVMGLLADAALAAGGRVVGVMPQSLVDKEIAHQGLHELHVVESMHARKALMADLSDGFVALPGGFGTLEEIIETLTWGQLGFHAKPCGLLNVNRYFDSLLQFLDQAVTEGFVRNEHRGMLLVRDSARELLTAFEDYAAPVVDKWRR